ncbi:hypothetical protein WJX73_002267 [Symbiochloris irregularis]|uniref:Uncharacterized protein n=1 Tax=Symbiochloris irregularis TaxID=706552 RepID=A0AAW1NQN8_9CHLO
MPNIAEGRAEAAVSASRDAEAEDWETGWEEGLAKISLHAQGQSSPTTVLEKEVLRLATGNVHPVIRRFNNETALAVFSDPGEARAALAAPSKLAMRPYSEASEASRAWPRGELLPPRPRPKSSPVMAQRLIGHALGHRGLRSKDAEQELESQRQQKQAHTVAKKQGLEAAWAD